jgi:hypothetical protein
MLKTGGVITDITWNHPQLGTGVIYAKGSEDSTYDPGGLRSGDDANMIDGAGNAIYSVNPVRPSFEVKISWDWDDDTLGVLADMGASPYEGTWTFTNVNGVIYKLIGKPVGDIQGNGNESTIQLKIQGSGVMQIIG